jgi:DNA (cytosine-5)-methyltransferase 1
VRAYYNEFDPKAAAWIKQLIKNGMIADGEVDERSITEVTADEIRGFTQHHFFAGIGGWSYSLRLAGWADDRPVCTASLPCQPFSVAGAQKGVDDERHLLPHFIELVKQCNFQTIFGEQVPGAIKHGWLDDLCTEMEREKYRVGQIVLTAAGEGAPHIRQRLYWVADNIDKGSQGRLSGWQDQEREVINGHAGCSGTVGGLSDTENRNRRPESQLTASGGRESWYQSGRDGSCSGMADTSSDRLGRGDESERRQRNKMLKGSSSDNDGLGNTEHDGQPTSLQSRSDATSVRHSKTWTNSTSEFEGTGTPRTISEWTDPDWIYCRDEKYRPIKPGIEPLANGLPKGMGYGSDPSEPIDADNTQEARVMRLKGYGNAIVPQVASQFISAFMATQ